MRKVSGIYSIKNLKSGRMYIGSSYNIRARWNKHKRDLRRGKHHSLPLQRAFDKYGEQSFEFKMLIICRQQDMLLYEQRAIDAFNSCDNGYNVSKIAGSRAGVKHAPEVIAKLKLAAKNRAPKSDEYRKKMAKIMREKIAKGDLAVLVL